MTILSILETILIGPLKLVFEIIFDIANRVIGHPGLAIIVLSLSMNVLVLPLYRRADAMQEQARDIDAKLQANADYADRRAFGRKCLWNIASAGKFSSDRTIRQYAEEIWHIEPTKY